MTREERRVHWLRIIDDQATSGQSVADFCRKSNIKRSGFYAWRRKLEAGQSVAPGFIELKADRGRDVASGIRIHLGAGLAIEVDRDFDPFTLLAVVEALKRSRCLA